MSPTDSLRPLGRLAPRHVKHFVDVLRLLAAGERWSAVAPATALLAGRGTSLGGKQAPQEQGGSSAAALQAASRCPPRRATFSRRSPGKCLAPLELDSAIWWQNIFDRLGFALCLYSSEGNSKSVRLSLFGCGCAGLGITSLAGQRPSRILIRTVRHRGKPHRVSF